MPEQKMIRVTIEYDDGRLIQLTGEAAGAALAPDEWETLRPGSARVA